MPTRLRWLRMSADRDRRCRHLFPSPNRKRLHEVAFAGNSSRRQRRLPAASDGLDASGDSAGEPLEGVYGQDEDNDRHGLFLSFVRLNWLNERGRSRWKSAPGKTAPAPHTRGKLHAGSTPPFPARASG